MENNCLITIINSESYFFLLREETLYMAIKPFLWKCNRLIRHSGLWNQTVKNLTRKQSRVKTPPTPNQIWNGYGIFLCRPLSSVQCKSLIISLCFEKLKSWSYCELKQNTEITSSMYFMLKNFKNQHHKGLLYWESGIF